MENKNTKFDFDKSLTRIKKLIKRQYRQDAEFRMNVVLSQIGDISRHLTHDPKLCPPARPYGTRKNEEDAFGHSLMQLLMAAEIRKIDIKKALENAINNLNDNDYMRKERKHKKGIVLGTVGHPGKITGMAFVDPEGKNFDSLDGHILVTEHVRPDIVGYLKKIKGIVANQGGVFCHAAILAREYDIPCIVGTGNATEIITHGQKIKILADSEESGTVHLILE